MRTKELGLSIIAMLMALIGGVTIARADTNMPQGLPIRPYFQVGTFNGSNSANIIDGDNGDGTEAVQLTNAKNQLGTIWAKKDDYYFDLSKNQKASMWMNFGSGSGDGMALVLQNDHTYDPDGYKATAVMGRPSSASAVVPAVGQTLGTWGYYLNTNDLSNRGALTAANAIQNSWALEFDTFVNNQDDTSTSNGAVPFYQRYTSFDKSGSTATAHMASNYPAQASTYRQVEISHSNSAGTALLYDHYTVMNHNGILPLADSMKDGNWHHVTLEYTAPDSYPGTGKMKYTFDDKDPVTDGVSRTISSHSAEVDIDTQKIDPDNTKKALWGFTGATGDNFENNQVVFEQIPGLVDASASAKIYDRTQGNVEVPEGAALNGGDRLKLAYNLKYNSGRRDWSSIEAQLQLPSNLTVDSGTISYADGSQETVDLANYKPGDTSLNYTLKKALSSTNDSAEISLNATTDNPATTTVVAPTTSKFVGPLGITSASLPSYQIAHTSATLVAQVTSGNSVNIQPNQTTDVTGTATLTGAAENTSFTLHPNLNGNDMATTSFTSTKKNGSYTGNFNYQPAASDLHTGVNTLSLYVSGSMGYSSQNMSVLIYVSGILSFANVPQTISFTDTQLTGTSQMISRDGDWNLEVNDARGTGSEWQLSAQQTKPMTSETTPSATLDGTLIYKASPTATPVPISATSAVPVASHTTTSNNDTTDATAWGSDSGVLLKVNSSATDGTYKGEITWSLSNAPGNG